MMSTVETYIVGLLDLKKKLTPLYKEAFENLKDWELNNLCATFWLTQQAEAVAKGEMVNCNLWLYIPENGMGKNQVNGVSPQLEDGMMLAFRDANTKAIDLLKQLGEQRKTTVAKADFYRSMMNEMIELGRDLN